MKSIAPYNTGLEVVAVTLHVKCKAQIKCEKQRCNRADQDKATYIQQAQAYASKVVPLAQVWQHVLLLMLTIINNKLY